MSATILHQATGARLLKAAQAGALAGLGGG